jgi:ABC-type antimicrobial peptide transport system permease subunit
MNKLISKIKISYISLMRQKTRTILTIMAVAIGIASLIIMLSAGDGLKSLVLGELEIYGSDTISIEISVPGKGLTGTASSFASGGGLNITTFKNKDVDAISELDSIETHYSYITGQEIIKYENEAKSVMMFGYGGNAPLIEKIELKDGRFYSIEEETSLSSVIVLGSKTKDLLFGENDAIGKNVYLRNLPFRVVGVLEEKGATFGLDMDSVVYIPTLTMQKKILGTDYVMGLAVKVKDIKKIDETKEDILLLLRERHDIANPDEDDFQVMTMLDARKMMDTVLSLITLLLVIISAVSLLVGGVGITNIMYVSVVERTFEIGLRRAVGAKKDDIMWQFLVEAMLLTFMGGFLGVLTGIICSYLVSLIATSFGINLGYSVSVVSVLLSLVFSLLIGVFFGVYPAKKASSMDPINALRKE